MLSISAKICLSIQRALLGVVTPSLRRVSFTLMDHLITVYFIYDEEITELEEELPGGAEAEMIADFPGAYMRCLNLKREPFSKKISSEGQIVFNRYEEI